MFKNHFEFTWQWGPIVPITKIKVSLVTTRPWCMLDFEYLHEDSIPGNLFSLKSLAYGRNSIWLQPWKTMCVPIIICSFWYISLKSTPGGLKLCSVLPEGCVWCQIGTWHHPWTQNYCSFLLLWSFNIKFWVDLYIFSLGDGCGSVDISVTKVLTHDASSGDQDIPILCLWKLDLARAN